MPEYDWKDTGEFSDTADTSVGWVEEGSNERPCSHYLPIMMEATVNGSPVYAAGFTNWFTSEPVTLSRTPSLANMSIGLTAPETGSAGSEIDLQVQIATDGRSMDFQWYIDDGY